MNTIPAVATLGAALAIIGWLQPPLIQVNSIKLLAMLVVGILAVSLVLMFYDVRRTSRRLRRKEVWLATAAAVLAIAGILLTEWRAQRIEQSSGEPSEQSAPSVPPPPG